MCVGKENETECQRNRIASGRLSGKTVRCSSNRFVQVRSTSDSLPYFWEFLQEIGRIMQSKGLKSPCTLNEKLIFICVGEILFLHLPQRTQQKDTREDG